MKNLDFKITHDSEAGAYFVQILVGDLEAGRRMFASLDQAQFYISILQDAVRLAKLLE